MLKKEHLRRDLIVSVKYGDFSLVFYVVFLEDIFIYFNKNVEPLNETL